MIRRLTHATIWVEDQERALDFYTNKLGFEVKTDQTMGTFRWLTVGPKGQTDLELVLMLAAPTEMVDEETVAMIRKLIAKGAMGAGVFGTDDCRKTYEELRAKGVEFRSEPKERPYGVEAIFVDDSGNWFSLTQQH